MENKEFYMARAITLAHTAASFGDVPVGCVIVRDGEIIGEGYNRREQKKNALLHAEIDAINNACAALGTWHLDFCTLYVTLEPCPMCAGAIINSRIQTVCYGAKDKKGGAVGSVINLFEENFNHKPIVYSGILEQQCRQILEDFFKNLR